jgi:hypothetical protein
LILNIGRNQGASVGQVLTIEHKLREVKDPETGAVIREVTEPIGTVKITEVDAISATGVFTGSGTPQVGDRVKSL